ncbi:MAG TPA: CPBP family intramembrane glutamic endopeptidase [Chloroflexota bacterium]|jgi:membrane protease YdiL (CAAX protease family)
MAHAELAQPVDHASAGWWKALVAFGGLGFVLAIGVALGGQAGNFASAGLSYVPLIVLGAVLQLRAYPVLRIVSWLWFWLTLAVFALLSLTLIFLTFADPSLPLTFEIGPRLVAPIVAMLVILVVSAAVAATPAWAWLAAVLGANVDRESPAHAQGAVGVLALSAMSIAPLALLGGRAPLIDLLNRIDGTIQPLSTVDQLLMQVYSVLWIGVLVLFGTGWPVLRTVRDALARLGIGPLQRRDVAALAVVTAATIGVGIVLDVVNRALLGVLGLPMTDPTVVLRLVPAAATPVGALVIAACAGVSEELMFRGWLQPRLGWLLANLGFVAAHAFQYGLDGLVAVFVLGAILAFVRQRWNTTASIGVHFAYDAVLFLLTILGF